MEGKSVRKNQQGMECEENIRAVTWSKLDIFYFISTSGLYDLASPLLCTISTDFHDLC